VEPVITDLAGKLPLGIWAHAQFQCALRQVQRDSDSSLWTCPLIIDTVEEPPVAFTGREFAASKRAEDVANRYRTFNHISCGRRYRLRMAHSWFTIQLKLKLNLREKIMLSGMGNMICAKRRQMQENSQKAQKSCNYGGKVSGCWSL